VLPDTSILEKGHESWTKPFYWKIVLTFVAVIIFLTAAINFTVNPFGLYAADFFPKSSFNRYSNLRQLFINSDPQPEAVIIGSSRVGSIDPEIVTEITGRRCFNWGVPAAEAEIYTAILKMAIDEFNAPIDMVIVGVEPEFLHPTKRIHPQAAVLREYTKYFSDESPLNAGIERARRLITYEQLWASAIVVKRLVKGEPSGDWVVWRGDGFPVDVIEDRMPRRYQVDQEERLSNQVEIFAETYFHLSEFDSLSTERKASWEEFLRICNERNIRVYAFMPPPHPRILERLFQLGAEPIFIEAAEYLERTVTDSGGVFKNYTHVESFNGDPDGFQDHVHIHPDNGELMIRDLLSDF